MKKSELKMMIREVVREEIRLGLKEVIGGSKQPVQKSKPKQKQHYSKNPILNEVLNETQTEDWETMGGTTYTSERMGDLVGNSYTSFLQVHPFFQMYIVFHPLFPSLVQLQYYLIPHSKLNSLYNVVSVLV